MSATDELANIPLSAGADESYHRAMTFWQAKATRHGYENPRPLSFAAMSREDSQPSTGVVAV